MVRLILAGIAVVGFGFALLAIVGAPKTSAGVTGAVMAGMIPFLISTVALGAAGIMERVDTARAAVVDAIEASGARSKSQSAEQIQDASQPVTCSRCGKVVPAGKTIASSRGRICMRAVNARVQRDALPCPPLLDQLSVNADSGMSCARQRPRMYFHVISVRRPLCAGTG